MSIDLSAPPVPFSFEVYPPKSEAGDVALHETVRQLAADGRAHGVTGGAVSSRAGAGLGCRSLPGPGIALEDRPRGTTGRRWVQVSGGPRATPSL